LVLVVAAIGVVVSSVGAVVATIRPPATSVVVFLAGLLCGYCGGQNYCCWCCPGGRACPPGAGGGANSLDAA
jgi:hypothetical protein